MKEDAKRFCERWPDLCALFGIVALSIPTFYVSYYWKPAGRYLLSAIGNLLLLPFIGLVLWRLRRSKFDFFHWTKETIGLVRPRQRHDVPLGALAGALFFVGALLVLGHVAASTEPLALVVLSAVVIAPVSEEILDRGVVFGLLRKNLPRWLDPPWGIAIAYLGSAAFFMWSHYELFGQSNPAQFFAFGLVLNLLVHKTGSLLPAMAAHAVDNALVTFYPLLA